MHALISRLRRLIDPLTRPAANAAPARLLALPVAALGLPLLMISIGGWIGWQSEWQDAEAELTRTADAGAEYVSRGLAGYRAALDRFNDTTRGMRDDEVIAREREFNATLHRLLADLPLAETGYIVDRLGRPLVSASIYPVPHDKPLAADRDFFAALSGPTAPELHISQIYRSKIEGTAFFALSARRTGTGNGLPLAAFDGLVNISIMPVALAGGLRRLAGEGGDPVTLARADGVVLARSTGPDLPVAQIEASSPFHAFAGAGVAQQRYRTVAGTSPVRLVAMQRVEGFPLYVVASRARSVILVDWAGRVGQHLIFGVPATLALFLLSLTVRRSWLRLNQQNAALETALVETDASLRRVQEAGGTLTFELRDDGVIICDDDFRAMLHASADQPVTIQHLLTQLTRREQIRMRAGLRALRHAGGRFNTEVRLTLPNGSVRWLLILGEATPTMPRRIIGVATDITQRKHTEEAVRQSETRLLDLVETLNLASVFVCDLDGRITFWSDGCTAMFGWTRREAIGARAMALLRSTSTAPQAEIDAALAATGEWRGDVRKLRRDGSEVLVAVTRVLRRDAAGKPVSMLENCADVTALRRASAELARLNQRLESLVREEVELREAAQTRAAHAERIQALGQLAGGIAHDLNNVLQAVTSGASLLGREADKAAKVRSLSALISDAAQRGMAVTRRMLLFSRQADLRAGAIDIRAMLLDLQEVLAHTLGGHVVCDIQAPDGLPDLLADRGQLEIALVNLATNARDAMPHGGTIVIAAAAETVHDPISHPGGLAAGRYIKLSVRDSGTGMDAETLRRATEPFFTTKKVGSGTGLGLATVNGFATQSHGAMAITSAPGEGTTISLWLPQAEPDERPDMADAAEPTGQNSARLLLVDDDATVRALLGQQLEMAGFTVTAASDGATALALLGDGEAPVDIMVTDLSMPEMNGLELIRAVRARFPNLPAVLATGYASDHAIEPEDGLAFTLLRKPVLIGPLTAAITAALAGDASGAATR